MYTPPSLWFFFKLLHDPLQSFSFIAALLFYLTACGLQYLWRWSVLHQFTFHLCVDVAFILHRSNFFSDFFSCITSAPIPFFHRCAPVNISCYTKFAEALITFVSDSSILHRLISGVMTCKEIILGLCLLSLGNFFLILSYFCSIEQLLSPQYENNACSLLTLTE